jgi:hypothetical protein
MKASPLRQYLTCACFGLLTGAHTSPVFPQQASRETPGCKSHEVLTNGVCVAKDAATRAPGKNGIVGQTTEEHPGTVATNPAPPQIPVCSANETLRDGKCVLTLK